MANRQIAAQKLDESKATAGGLTNDDCAATKGFPMST